MDKGKHKLKNPLLAVLSYVPTHRDRSATVDEIGARIAKELGISSERARSLTSSALAFLELIGIVNWTRGGRVRLAGQTAHYFVQCISWYLSHGQPLFENWGTAGTPGEAKGMNMLESGPYFLKALEERRLKLAKRQGLDPQYSRVQRTAVLLIRTTVEGTPYFLHQWDTRAEQYQLLGGRCRPKEAPLDTAKRELDEEIASQKLLHRRDYELCPMTKNDQPVTRLAISRTYGALTYYEHWVYSVVFCVANLQLSELDRWFSLEELCQGFSQRGDRISDPELTQLFDAALPGGLAHTPDSIDLSRVTDSSKYFES